MTTKKEAKKQELKPCPFCGGKAVIQNMGYPHYIYCSSCGAKVHGHVIGAREGKKASIEAWNRRAGEKEPEKAAEASQSTKKSWTAEEIQKAADLLKERFLQNADFLFCSPEDEADIEKKVGDRFKVKGMQGIPPGRIYLVDRKEMERWWPSRIAEQEDET